MNADGDADGGKLKTKFEWNQSKMKSPESLKHAVCTNGDAGGKNVKTKLKWNQSKMKSPDSLKHAVWTNTPKRPVDTDIKQIKMNQKNIL